MYLKPATWSYFAENGWTRGENWILWRVVGGNWDGVTLDFPADRKILPSLFSIWLDTEPGMNFPVDFSVEFVSFVIPFWGWDSMLKNRMKNCYKNNNNNILNGMNVWQMDIKNCTSDEIKDKGKEIMKFYFNKVRVFTLWIKLCSPI